MKRVTTGLVGLGLAASVGFAYAAPNGTRPRTQHDRRREPVADLEHSAGAPWRARVQMYDAPFSLHTADSMTLHTNGKPSLIRGQDAKPLFNDTKKYWYSELPNHGVKLPVVGVKIQVLTE